MEYNISDSQILIITLFVLWDLIWKGFALWRAAQRKQPIWFVALLVLNTAGFLPIIYILMTEQRDIPEEQPQ